MSLNSRPLSLALDEADYDDELLSLITVESPRRSRILQEQDPIDFKIIAVHFLLGCAGLVPCSLLVTVLPFLQSRIQGSSAAGTFSSYFFLAQNLSQLIALAHATAISKSSSPSRQTRLTIRFLLLLIFLTTLSSLIETTPGMFLTFIMFIAISSAALVAYCQSSVFVVASIFGPKAVQAVMAGQAAVAVVVSLVELGSVAKVLHSAVVPTSKELERNGRTPEELSAFVCFAFSTCILGVSLAAHSWMLKTPAYKSLILPIELRLLAKSSRGHEERQSLLSSSVTSRRSSAFLQETTFERIVRVAKANVIYEVAIAYVFVITLSVFPPITTSILPVNNWFHPLIFNALHVLIFNIGDLFGRYLCTFPSFLIWSPKRLLGLSLSHTIFIPLLIACNIKLPSNIPSILPDTGPLINSDLLFFLILFAFGTSNGYVSTLCLMAAPSLHHNKRLKGHEDVDTAVTISLFCMIGGLTVGSFASFGVRMLVCGCNPFVG